MRRFIDCMTIESYEMTGYWLVCNIGFGNILALSYSVCIDVKQIEHKMINMMVKDILLIWL